MFPERSLNSQAAAAAAAEVAVLPEVHLPAFQSFDKFYKKQGIEPSPKKAKSSSSHGKDPSGGRAKSSGSHSKHHAAPTNGKDPRSRVTAEVRNRNNHNHHNHQNHNRRVGLSLL
jgi:hypothetical protein